MLFSVLILWWSGVIKVEEFGVFSIRVVLLVVVFCVGGVLLSRFVRLCVSLLCVVCWVGV